MAERLTFHSGYRNAMGKAYNSKHNQREGFSKPQKGDTPRPPNVYWDFGEKLGGATFSENEMLFYKRFLGPHIKRQNEKNKAARHYERCETVASYKEKHPPQEDLIYLGRKNANAGALEPVCRDFIRWLRSDCWDKETGGVMPLNGALHWDETSAHFQLRLVYLYRDKAGDWQVSQNKALAALGYAPPDPTKPVGKKNNAKMTFTAACREKLFELARNYGVELETEPLPKDEVGLPLKDYIQREQAREAAAAEQQAAQEVIAGLNEDIAELEEDKADVADELERLRRSTVREKAARDEKREAAEKQANEIIEQAKKDAKQLKSQAWELGAREGAASVMGQLNKRLREEDEDEEQEGQDGPKL